MTEDFLTTREKIYEILKKSSEPLSIEDIILVLRLSPRDYGKVVEDLEHLRISVKKRSNGIEEIVIIPAYCSNCGYIFKKREKIKKPSKCPKCYSSRIKGPWFYLKRKY